VKFFTAPRPLALRLSAGALFGAAGLLGAIPARAQIGLSATSPFVSGPSAAGAGDSAEQFELAGASTTDHSADVCIYDTHNKRSRWISVGSTDGGIQVLSYDAVNNQAVIRVNGTQKLLAQRKASVQAGAMPAPTMAAMVNYGTPDNAAAANPPPVVNPAEAGKSPEVVKQEREARMLVSDLLEIGIQQRKAYEEAQKKAAKGR
jgi:hypothetical protein